MRRPSSISLAGRLAAPAVLAALIAVGSLRIAATWRVFSQTFDEPAHIACGMEWLDRGTYQREAQHPPLARVAAALPLYLRGLHDSPRPDPEIFPAGNDILHYGNRYAENLAAARAGVLPFFWLACLGVFFWSRRLAGTWPALAAVLLFTSIPPVLAHAALATTDMALTATFTWALFLFALWVEAPRLRLGLALATALAAMALSKFSCVLFFPAAALAVLALAFGGKPAPVRPLRRYARPLAVVALTAALLVWAGYRFSVGTVQNAKSMQAFLDSPHGRWSGVARLVAHTPVPAEKFFWGVASVMVHARMGHRSFLLGRQGQYGWWYFFPVVLGVKTPLGFSALALLGLWIAGRGFRRTRDWRPAAPAAAAAAILLVSLPSTVALGSRHILPVYSLLAVAAAVAASALWNVTARPVLGRTVVVLLIAWTVASAAAAHPDYLAYFNELAGGRPECILVGSDLDWGQDLYRLRDRARALGIPRLSVAYFGSADVTRQDLPSVTPLQLGESATGWVAASVSLLEMVPEQFRWLEGRPYQMVGRSIRLYWVPPDARP